jgi:hypothetical protein
MRAEVTYFRLVRKSAKSDYVPASVSVRLSVCSHGTTRLPLDSFSINHMFEYFSKIYRGKFKIYSNPTRITCTVYEDQFTFMIIIHNNFLRQQCLRERASVTTYVHSRLVGIKAVGTYNNRGKRWRSG